MKIHLSIFYNLVLPLEDLNHDVEHFSQLQISDFKSLFPINLETFSDHMKIHLSIFYNLVLPLIDLNLTLKFSCISKDNISRYLSFLLAANHLLSPAIISNLETSESDFLTIVG